MSDLTDLLDEASEIIRNAKTADITPEQREQIIRQTLLDVGYQLEIVPQERNEE